MRIDSAHGELLDVLGHTHDSMRVNAAKIGHHQRLGQERGIVLEHPASREDRDEQGAQLLGNSSHLGCRRLEHRFIPLLEPIRLMKFWTASRVGAVTQPRARSLPVRCRWASKWMVAIVSSGPLPKPLTRDCRLTRHYYFRSEGYRNRAARWPLRLMISSACLTSSCSIFRSPPTPAISSARLLA